MSKHWTVRNENEVNAFSHVIKVIHFRCFLSIQDKVASIFDKNRLITGLDFVSDPNGYQQIANVATNIKHVEFCDDSIFFALSPNKERRRKKYSVNNFRPNIGPTGVELALFVSKYKQ